MDTDDLSIETYEGVIIEAEKFNHDLTLQFGVLASSCKNEEEYLNKAERLITRMLTRGKEDLSDMFFGSPPKIENLHSALMKILNNISEIKKIPEDKRHYDDY